MCKFTQTFLRFKSKKQLPLVMIYKLWFGEEKLDNEEPYDGKVLFNSMKWIGI